MKNFIKKPIVALIAAVAVIIAIYFYFSGNKKPDYEFVVVKRAEIIQEVSVTGRVKPAEDVNLAFEKSGKVSNIYAKVADKITVGQILAQLDNVELYAQLAQAQADLKTQKIKLAELRRGTREEEIKVQEVKVANAKVTIEEAKKNLIDKLQDAYTKSDDAVRNKVDQFFRSPSIPVPQIIFSITDSQLEIDIEWQRLVVEDALKAWKSSLTQLNLLSDLNSYLNAAKNNLNQIKSFLDKIALVANDATASANLPQTTIDSWRADLSTARTNINTAISNLSAAEEKLNIAQSSLALSQQELSLKKSGATDEEIETQEAQVEKAQANVLNYNAQIAKTVLRSPIAGTVTKQDAKVGEIIPANTPVISVISSAKLEIEADIYEEDIVKVKVGDPVDIKIVAFPQKIFKGKVISINPAEKIINEVVHYKVTANFEEIPEEVRPGMTVDIIIKIASKENILIIPREAVKKIDNKTITNVFKNGKIEEREIMIGLKGNDFFEVVSGLEEGEQIVTGEK